MTSPLARLATLGALGLFAGMFHTHLVKSAPGNRQTLTSSPTEVRLWFSERPEVPFTSVTILRADSTRVATIKAVATDDSLAVSAPLPAPLGAGAYVIQWRTASSDGHAIRGRIEFSIAP
jgi:methionine-rich copper-binding protein CopC